MNWRGRAISTVLTTLLLVWTLVVVGAGPDQQQSPGIIDQGDGRFAIGNIVLDKPDRSFTIPGQILRVNGPLEYLAVTTGGLKSYESLLELNVTAFEFNTACLLIGLDPDNSRPSPYHFDPNPVVGDEVKISVSWTLDSKPVEYDAADLLTVRESVAAPGGWSYTGSGFTRENRYLAHLDGTLIGFAHDPASVIEHGKGLGLGDYGAVNGHQGRLPPVGTEVVLTVRR
ncbi:MAG: hypothetical protein GY703_14070 [Gammaproteobacteria bacterium]|nr:hypothetical protein [Gammaproteobacteria bacterium]